jgi:hypothetical protein
VQRLAGCLFAAHDRRALAPQRLVVALIRVGDQQRSPNRLGNVVRAGQSKSSHDRPRHAHGSDTNHP